MEGGWLARLQAWRRHAFGNLGFDLLLLFVASALVLAMGLYPAQPRQPDEVAPVTRLTTPKAHNQTTHSRPDAGQAENRRGQQDRNSEKNRYDSLRKAWGG